MWVTVLTAGPPCTDSMLLISTDSPWRRAQRERATTPLADEGVPFREIAGVIGRRLNVPVVSKSPEQAPQHFGWLAHFVGMDSPASSKLTEEKLEWQPKQLGLIADLEQGTYFEPERTTHAPAS